MRALASSCGVTQRRLPRQLGVPGFVGGDPASARRHRIGRARRADARFGRGVGLVHATFDGVVERERFERAQRHAFARPARSDVRRSAARAAPVTRACRTSSRSARSAPAQRGRRAVAAQLAGDRRERRHRRGFHVRHRGEVLAEPRRAARPMPGAQALRPPAFDSSIRCPLGALVIVSSIEPSASTETVADTSLGLAHRIARSQRCSNCRSRRRSWRRTRLHSRCSATARSPLPACRSCRTEEALRGPYHNLTSSPAVVIRWRPNGADESNAARTSPGPRADAQASPCSRHPAGVGRERSAT